MGRVSYSRAAIAAALSLLALAACKNSVDLVSSVKEELMKVNICRKNLDKVLSNVTGQFHKQDEDWADLMASQIKMPVLWESCMRQVLSLGSANGSIKFYELGCGKTLCGMMKRIDKQALCFNLDTFDQLKDI